MKLLILVLALIGCGKDPGKKDNNEKLGYDTREILWDDEERSLMNEVCIDATLENHANVIGESAVPACKCYIDEIAKTYTYGEFMDDFDTKVEEFNDHKETCRDKYLEFE